MDFLKAFFLLSLIFIGSENKAHTHTYSFGKQDYHGYRIVPYEQLDIMSMRVVRSTIDKNNGEIRTVYYDKENNVFLKIWSEKYSKAQNFCFALCINFFEDLAPLVGVIFDNKLQCREYVTSACHEKKLLVYCINRHGYECLEVADKQESSYQLFYEKLLERCLLNDLYYIDLTPSNIVKNSDKYYLIDLEALLFKHEIQKMKEYALGDWNMVVDYVPMDYALFLQSIIERQNDIDK